MGASNRDIALTVIAKGEHAYYSSVKGIGSIIWDTRTGIFSEEIPKAGEVFAFVKGTEWEDCLECLDKPLLDPVYGSITIDFDNKTVTDANGYGPSNRIFFKWLSDSLKAALNGEEGLIPKVSLLEHFKHGRIQLLAGLRPYGEALRFENLETAGSVLLGLEDSVWDSERKFISFACILMPDPWTLIDNESSN